MSARLNAFRAAVVATIAARMPHLRECEEQFGRFDLDELERTPVRAPAVRVAVIRARCGGEPNGQVSADLHCAAFVVTDGRDRDASAWAIAEAIVTMLHSGQMWGLTRVASPSHIDITPSVRLDLKQRGVSIAAVEWRQTVRNLGDGIWDDEQHLLDELYVNDELVPLEALQAPEDGDE